MCHFSVGIWGRRRQWVKWVTFGSLWSIMRWVTFLPNCSRAHQIERERKTASQREEKEREKERQSKTKREKDRERDRERKKEQHM